MESITVTFFADKQSHEKTYTGNVGAGLMALMDADEHIRAGGWCLMDDGKVCQMIERPIFGRDGRI